MTEKHEAKSEDVHGHGHHDAAPAKASSNKPSGVTGFLHNLLQRVLDQLGKTLRSFVAFAMAMLFIGALFGYFIPSISQRVAIQPQLLLAIPLVLAVLSYYVTEIAALLFILLLGIFLLAFL